MYNPAGQPPSDAERNGGVPSYLARLTQTPLLTPDEEKELSRRARSGEEGAKRKLIEANMRLVINIARHYRTRAIPLEDLIQEGAIGLMNAVDRFDPDLGYRFSTYATHWIRQAIGRALDSKAKAIRIPFHVTQSLRQVERERSRLTRELGREPSANELAEAMGISVKKLILLLQSSQDTVSLDMMVGEDDNADLGSLIPDSSMASPESSAILRETVGCLDEIMSHLTERERSVVRKRLGLDNESDSSLLKSIGGELNLSRERIRQIEAQAIRKLRHIAQRRRLKDILGS